MLAWEDQANSSSLKHVKITNTSGTPTVTSAVSSASGVGRLHKNGVTGTGTDSVWVVLSQTGGSANRGQNHRFKMYEATTNRTSWHYVGFTDQAYSDGQTATVYTYGNTKNGFSGLTPGTMYYATDSGDIQASSTGTTTTLVGIAITSSTMLIREPSNMTT